MSSTSELQFIETDAGKIYDFIMYVLENGVTEELYPGDERRIFGETLATLVVALYSTMNDSPSAMQGATFLTLWENLRECSGSKHYQRQQRFAFLSKKQ